MSFINTHHDVRGFFEVFGSDGECGANFVKKEFAVEAKLLFGVGTLVLK